MRTLSLFALLISASAFAAAPDSIYNFKPAAGNHNINFRPGIMDSVKGDYKVNNVKTADLEVTTSLYMLDYMYTINDTATVGARTAMGTIKTKTTTESKQTGMTDLILVYGGKSVKSAGALHWGADLNFSPGKGKQGSTTSDGNLYSGGMALTPMVSWVGKMSSLDWGVTGKYYYPMERKVDTAANVENTYTGGSAFTLMPFIEVPFNNGRAGASLRYTSTGETKVKAGSAAETMAYGAYTTLALGGSVAYSFTDTFAGLADFEYASNTDYQIAGADKTTLTGINLTLGARATF